ncbi:MAG: hypothetical protein ACOC10_11255, partial [Bacteroidota bacterium]
PGKFAEVMKIIDTAAPPVNWRAAKAIDLCCEHHPELLHPWIEMIVNNIDKTNHDSTLRSYLRMLSRYTGQMNEDQLGIIFDFSFETLFNENKAVAIRYYAMEIMVNVAKREPALKNEIMAALEELLPRSTPTFKNAIRRSIKKTE